MRQKWVSWEGGRRPILIVLNSTPAVPVPYCLQSWPSTVHSVSAKAASRLNGIRPPITSSLSAAIDCHDHLL